MLDPKFLPKKKAVEQREGGVATVKPRAFFSAGGAEVAFRLGLGFALVGLIDA